MSTTDKSSGETNKSSGSILDSVSTALGMSTSKGEGDTKSVKTASGVDTAFSSRSSENSSIEDTTSNEESNTSSQEGATSREESQNTESLAKLSEPSPNVEPLVKADNIVVAPKKQGKRKTNKLLLFKKNKIVNLFKKIKSTKKTEEQLLEEMESIVNVQIEREIKKNSDSIKRLKKEKNYLINKIKKEFTKKNKRHLYPRLKNSPPKKTIKMTKIIEPSEYL